MLVKFTEFEVVVKVYARLHFILLDLSVSITLSSRLQILKELLV